MRVLRSIGNLWIWVLCLATACSGLLVSARFILPLTSPVPMVEFLAPANAASAVSIRSQISMRFDQPMNPRLTEQAIRVEPAVPAVLIWDAQFSTLTISPTVLLQPSQNYQVSVTTDAQSRTFARLSQQQTLQFRTAPAPAVLATEPADQSSGVSPDARLLIRFSRVMVTSAALHQYQPVPWLQLEPAIPARVFWVDQSTALIRPELQLMPGQQYHATITTSLSDADGASLGQPVEWRFATSPVEVLEFTPAAASLKVGTATPISLRLSQALTPTQLSAALTITPTHTYAIEQQRLPDATQVVTITPAPAWEPATIYTARFTPPNGNSQEWRFATAPPLTLVGRYPGEGQVLPLGEPIRLIFSTAVDPQQLQKQLQLEPPAEQIAVTGNGSEVRIDTALQAATSYTLTVSAVLSDTSGSQLSQPLQMRFVTAPAAPSLAVVEASNRLVHVPASQPISLTLQRTNLSSLRFDLYALDEATLIRTLGFTAADWRLFEPERYQQPLRNSWSLSLSDRLNSTVQSLIPITDANGATLAAGIYYVRIRSPEGPRADLLLSSSPVRLAIHVSPQGGVAWATNVISATVLPDLPLAIYQDDVLILEGRTNSAGILPFQVNPNQPHAYTALLRMPAPTLATTEPGRLVQSVQASQLRLALFTNGSVFQPGQQIALSGVVRSDTLVTPTGTLEARAILTRLGGQVLAEQRSRLSTSGLFTMRFQLDTDTMPGRYQLVVDLGTRRETIDLQVRAADPAESLQVYLSPVQPGDTPEYATILSAFSNQQNRSGIPITWQLQAEPARLPFPPGYTVGLSGAPRPEPRQGTALTDEIGRITLPISLTDQLRADSPAWRYTLTVSQTLAGGPELVQQAAFLAYPTTLVIGIRPERTIIPADQPIRAALLAQNPAGAGLANQLLLVQLFRNETPDQPVASQRQRSSTTGTAQVVFSRQPPGSYRLRASGLDERGTPFVSEVTLYVAGAAGNTTNLALIPEQARQPGQPATMLARLPEARPATLLLSDDGQRLAYQIQPLRPGQILTTTITNQRFSPLELTLIDPGQGQQPARSTSTTMLPGGPEPLRVTVTPDQTSYTPGATATLSVTVTSADGSPASADLLVGLFSEPVPLTSEAAFLQTDQPAASTSIPIKAASFWSDPVRTISGTAVLTMTLPAQPGQWYATVWALGSDSVSQASQVLELAQPIIVRLDGPAFVRPTDQTSIDTLLFNTSSLTATLVLTPTATGMSMASSSISQTVTLAPHASSRLEWPVQITSPTSPTVSLQIAQERSTSQLNQTLTVVSGAAAAPQQAGLFMLRDYRDLASGRLLEPDQLQPGMLVHVRLTLVVTSTLAAGTLVEPLRAGASISTLPTSQQFRLAEHQPDQLVLAHDALEPGLYVLSYRIRIERAGRYQWPAPGHRLRSP